MAKKPMGLFGIAFLTLCKTDRFAHRLLHNFLLFYKFDSKIINLYEFLQCFFCLASIKILITVNKRNGSKLINNNKILE